MQARSLVLLHICYNTLAASINEALIHAVCVSIYDLALAKVAATSMLQTQGVILKATLS